ncbi:sodium bile acid symporter family-domain-containing protein [Chytridium lagenaria]|nr:sodium bile acid symporter family-domain-containing protein [Chytridium lagenaria]
MVLIWNQLAGGDAEWCAILVAVNALLQLVLFGPTAYFLCVIVGRGDSYQIDLWLITRSVLIFLGIPLVGGVITRFLFRFALGLKWKGAYKWYDETLMKYLGPTSLLGLLFTIVVMFTLQGQRIVNDITGVLRVSVPLLLYFTIVFSGTFLICLYFTRTPFTIAVTQSFTAAGNNFELAIAVAVASYGIDSKEALATVIGPLIEVPVLLGLVHLALAFKTRYDAHMIRKYGSANPDGVNEDIVAGCGKLQQELEEVARDEEDFLKATKTDMESTRKAEQQASIATLNA